MAGIPGTILDSDREKTLSYLKAMQHQITRLFVVVIIFYFSVCVSDMLQGISLSLYSLIPLLHHRFCLPSSLSLDFRRLLHFLVMIMCPLLLCFRCISSSSSSSPFQSNNLSESKTQRQEGHDNDSRDIVLSSFLRFLNQSLLSLHHKKGFRSDFFPSIGTFL